MTSLKTTVGTKGQAVIPKPLRDKLGIRPGDELQVREEQGRVVMEKKDAKRAWDELFEMFPKTKIAKGHDWDAEYEESYEE